MAGPVVGEPLVHEALAGLVHPDAAPHHRVEDRPAVGRHDARSEPRLVEQRGVGTDVDPGEERVAGVGRHARRPFVGHRWLVPLAEFAVALEPAGGEQHAAVGEDPDPFAVAHRFDADDPAPSSTMRRSNAVFVRTSPLPVLTNASRPRPMSAWPPTIVSGASTPQRSVHSGGRTSGSRSPSSVRSIVGGKIVRPLRERAGGVGEVVGHAAPLELADRRVGLEFLDHPRAGFEVRLAQGDRRVVADDRVEIRAGGVGATFEAGADLGRVAGEPDAGARPRRRAADELRLLDHERPQTAVGRGVGAEQPAARTDDDDVEGRVARSCVTLDRDHGAHQPRSCQYVSSLATGSRPRLDEGHAVGAGGHHERRAGVDDEELTGTDRAASTSLARRRRTSRNSTSEPPKTIVSWLWLRWCIGMVNPAGSEPRRLNADRASSSSRSHRRTWQRGRPAHRRSGGRRSRNASGSAGSIDTGDQPSSSPSRLEVVDCHDDDLARLRAAVS